MDGYFINPEGNLGHPVAYTRIHLTDIHTYINHIYIHIGRTYSHRVFSRYRKGSDPIVQSAMILTVSVSRRITKWTEFVGDFVWFRQGTLLAHGHEELLQTWAVVLLWNI